MKRIENMRQRALAFHFCTDEFFYRFYKRYEELSDCPSELERYSDAYYTALSSLTPSIGEGELIVGEIVNGLSDEQRAEWSSTYREIANRRIAEAGDGQDSHMAIDYELLLSKGIRGVMDIIDGYAKDASPKKAEFYSAAKNCLSAVIAHSEAYAALAEKMSATESDTQRKSELSELARICRRVPAEPAESFHEALQSVHFISYCLSLNPFRPGAQQFQLGHPDRYLIQYYKNDLQSGVITKEKARLLLDCLGIQINLRVPRGLSSGYMVGGRDTDGSIVSNELTDMLMQVIDDIRLVYPAVGLCYFDERHDGHLKKACDLLSRGLSHPAIFNDKVIVKGLESYGVPTSEAMSYIHSTCVEITPVAASNVWVASPYSNVAQLLLNTMDREYDSFEDHLAAFYKELDRRIETQFTVQNELRAKRAEHSVNPLLSCFVNDCLARGEDIERGGARYNWIMPSFVGMANLVDSLYVLKTLVYDEKSLTVAALRAALDANFECHEALRLRIIGDIPKYGNDIDEVDRYFNDIIAHVVSECKKYTPILSEGRLIPSVFCWIQHERYGKKTGATPDGRLAGFPLGDGSGPCQGREMKGPTASILSSTKWPHHELIGGVAVNMKFSKSSLGADSLKVMESLIKAYLLRGGFELQINVTDRDVLEKAIKDPESYRDLVVRIGGYSDYFTKLSPEMQQEVIARTEHRI